jgi:hypothetical protein
MPVLKLKTIADLKPASYNPRDISEQAFEGLKHSVSKYGDLSNITVNTRTGNTVAGHKRLEALVAKYGNKLPITTVDGESAYITTPDKKKWQIRIVDVSIDEEIEMNLAANNPGIQGTFTSEVIGLLDRFKANNAESFAIMGMEDIYKLPLKHITTDDLDDVAGKETPVRAANEDDGDLVTASFLMEEADRDLVYEVINLVRENKSLKIQSTSKALTHIAQSYRDSL